MYKSLYGFEIKLNIFFLLEKLQKSLKPYPVSFFRLFSTSKSFTRDFRK